MPYSAAGGLRVARIAGWSVVRVCGLSAAWLTSLHADCAARRCALVSDCAHPRAPACALATAPKAPRTSRLNRRVGCLQTARLLPRPRSPHGRPLNAHVASLLVSQSVINASRRHPIRTGSRGGEGGEAARGGVLEVTSLACEVSDAHGMRCHLMTCLTMCRPFDGLVFGVSKLALQLMRSLAVRGKWTLPS